MFDQGVYPSADVLTITNTHLALFMGIKEVEHRRVWQIAAVSNENGWIPYQRPSEEHWRNWKCKTLCYWSQWTTCSLFASINTSKDLSKRRCVIQMMWNISWANWQKELLRRWTTKYLAKEKTYWSWTSYKTSKLHMPSLANTRAQQFGSVNIFALDQLNPR